MTATRLAGLLALALASTPLGCGKKEDPAAPTQQPTKTTEAPPPAKTAAGPAWKDPPGWKRNPPANAMRVAEYVLPKLSGDVEDAECVVTTFGAGQGGSVDANIDRWVRQFESDVAGLDKSAKTVGGMKVTTIDLAGTYKGSGMPGAASGSKKSWRMTAAIVESPKGMYFFKLTGPDPTVKAARAAFDAMLDTLTP